jgi:hypothetical protein
MTCEWCGHEHARDALCTSRPTWSRRGFLALFGAGIAGLAVAPQLAAQPVVDVDVWVTAGIRGGKTLTSFHTFDEILKHYYEPVIAAQLNRRDLFRVTDAIEKKGFTVRVHAR